MDASFRAVRFILIRYLGSSWLTRKTRSNAAMGVALPMLGVAVGVCAFTIVLSVMGGFVQNLKSRLLSLDSHIEIVVKDSFGYIPENAELLKRVKNYSSEIVAVSPFQRGDAILQSNARPSTVLLVGVDTGTAAQSSGLESMLGGKSLNILNHDAAVANTLPEVKFPPVIVGTQLLMHLNAEIGDRVTLVSTMPEDGPGGMAPRQLPVVVTDRLESGNPAFDGKWAVAPLNLVNEFFGTEGLWAGIQVKVRDPLQADDLIAGLNAFLAKDNLRAKSWTESNKALVRALKLERWGMSFVMFMVILVGCFSITITLVLAVKRKSREMAILRAMGLRKRDLGGLYLLQGFAVGALGVFVGLATGLLALEVVKRVRLPVLTSAYNGQPLPVLVDWNDIGLVCVGSVLLAMIAALWPAIEVMKIDVVQTLADRE